MAEREMAAWWAKAMLWAQAPLDGRVPGPARTRLEKVKSTLRWADMERLWHREVARRQNVAKAAYVAVWMSSHGLEVLRWLGKRSAGRRWARGDGREWLTLCAARNVTTAEHVIRMLVDGLPGGVRWRTRADREAYVRTCVGCAGPADICYASPGPDSNGLAWCRGCAGAWAQGEVWAAFPTD